MDLPRRFLPSALRFCDCTLERYARARRPSAAMVRSNFSPLGANSSAHIFFIVRRVLSHIIPRIGNRLRNDQRIRAVKKIA